MRHSSRLTQATQLIIGIDARAATEVPAGRGRVVRELLRALADGTDDQRYVLYARQAWPGVPEERFRWRLVSARDPWWHVLTAHAANRECDVFLSTNSYLTPWFLRVPSVPIVYDMIAFEKTMQPNRRSAVIERVTLGPAVRRSQTLLCISRATEEALIERFPAARGQTVVAPLGVTLRPAEALDKGPEDLPPEGFVLAVGTLEPRKNLPRLVRAYLTLDEQTQLRHPLVVVGALGWETGETLEALRSLGERCIMLGYVSDAALAELYRRCGVFCYPSLGEGFGLPVLEAMAAGAAVITSNLSSLPEVGGEAVHYVDPREVTDIAAGLRRLLGDEQLRADLGQRARVRARDFSWEHFAEQTIKVLRAVGGAAGAGGPPLR